MGDVKLDEEVFCGHLQSFYNSWNEVYLPLLLINLYCMPLIHCTSTLLVVSPFLVYNTVASLVTPWNLELWKWHFESPIRQRHKLTFAVTWQGGQSWGQDDQQATAIVITSGAASGEELRYLKSTSMQLWFFGYELPGMQTALMHPSWIFCA